MPRVHKRLSGFPSPDTQTREKQSSMVTGILARGDALDKTMAGAKENNPVKAMSGAVDRQQSYVNQTARDMASAVNATNRTNQKTTKKRFPGAGEF